MRRIFYIVALSLLAFFSCQKSQPDLPVGKDDYVEGGTNYGLGMKIGSVVWAPVNCGTGNNYKYPYGLLYQWGRSDGQAYDGEPGAPTGDNLVNDQTSVPEPEKFYCGINGDWYSGTPFTEWPVNEPSNGIGNPCPKGWRVPTLDELQVLWGECYSPYVGQKIMGATEDYPDPELLGVMVDYANVKCAGHCTLRPRSYPLCESFRVSDGKIKQLLSEKIRI